jgi:hypothetical protein
VKGTRFSTKLSPNSIIHTPLRSALAREGVKARIDTDVKNTNQVKKTDKYLDF